MKLSRETLLTIAMLGLGIVIVAWLLLFGYRYSHLIGGG